MTGILNLLAGAVSSVIKDTYFNLTTLLLPGNGTNGAQNNTFLDSSTNNFTITRNGNTTQGTFSPFSQTGWSNFFDGTDDRLSVPDASKLELGSSAFTIECFAYNTAWDVDQNQLFEKGRFSVGKSYRGWMTATAIVLEVNVSGSATGAYTSFSVSTTNNLNQWYHIAFVRSGNSIYIFKDGVQIGSTGTLSGTAFDTSEALAIGGAADGNNNIMMNGYISNFRIITGQALATGTFSIPTSPLTTSSSGWAVSGSPVSLTGTVALLTCQSNRFVDNSASPLDITVGGGAPSVQAFSPFAPTAAYSAATVGGSGYFDGTGDMLETPSITIGTNNFCFECWLYPTVTQGATTGIFTANSTNGLQLSYFGTTGLGIAQKGVAFQVNNSDSKIPIVNQWNHVAFVRSGTGTNQTSIFLNGVRIANGTVSYSYAASLYQLSTTNAGGTVFQGYISGVRFSNGSTPYDATQTTITVPTAPPDASGSALCLQFTNAGITDATAKNDLETVGNAQISTTQSKFGGSSIYLDGTGDYLTLPTTNQSLTFGSANWTIEFWIYLPSLPNTRKEILYLNGNTSGYAAVALHICSNNKLGLSFSESGSSWKTDDTTGVGTALSATTWQYVAVTRNGQNIQIYLDGAAQGSAYTTTASTTSLMTTYTLNQIGTYNTSSFQLNAYIDDLRITLGQVRTVTTSPTSAFPLQ